MENNKDKSEPNPPQKIHKGCHMFVTLWRIFGIGATLCLIWLTVTSKQTTEVLNIMINANYIDSTPFKFYVVANATALMLILLSLVFVLIPISNPKKYFILFVMDFEVMVLLLTACTAATTIGFLGHNGNIFTGWTPICDHDNVFCERVQISITLSFVAVFLSVILTVSSAFISIRAQDPKPLNQLCC